MAFVKASKSKQKARVALVGPAGSGKTYTALVLGKALGDRIAVIDTERGSASKYSGDVADFDVSEMEGQFSPAAYMKEIKGAAAAGYDVLIIDSLSHAWEGTGGILAQVDQKGGRFDAWADMAPQLRDLIDAILSYPGHVIVSLRTKTEWVVEQVEKRGGGTTNMPRKVGLAPKFKDGLEYEFDVVALMDDAHVMTVTKSRCAALDGASIAKPGAAVADTLREWLSDGVDHAAEGDAVLAALFEAETPDALGAARERYDRVSKRLPVEMRAKIKTAGAEAKARIEAAMAGEERGA